LGDQLSTGTFLQRPGYNRRQNIVLRALQAHLLHQVVPREALAAHSL
jgi:hypothetical protein